MHSRYIQAHTEAYLHTCTQTNSNTDTHSIIHIAQYTVNPEKFGIIKISSGIRQAENLTHEIFLLRNNINYME